MLEVSLILFAMLAAMLAGIPIAYCLGIAGFVGGYMVIGYDAMLSQLGSSLFEAGYAYEFCVVPLFIFMGCLVSKTKISDSLFAAANAMIGHHKGGIGMATAVACGGFSAISGSSLATAATMSKAALPQMRKYGYHDRLATGVIAAGGTLGILIPPSIVLIFYGILTQQDIADLFKAGIIPGLLGVFGYMLAVRLVTFFRPDYGPRGDKTNWKQRLQTLKGILDFIILFAVVIGGMYSGIFTSVEAASIGAVSAFVLAGLRGKLSVALVKDALLETSKTTGMLFCIFLGALLLTSYINYSELPWLLTDLIDQFELSGVQVVLVVLMICMLLGMVLEAFSIILLIVPIALPILQMTDVNLIWFGIILVVTTEISLISPPVGMNVFVLKSVNPDISTGTIFKGVVPFIFIDLIRLAILIMFPLLSLVLVS
ncbi:TRAP transporter large permease [Marinomonas algicola]|uniref:TRAP transporter large permease n=1 Tax=Marinomonas algicola TaxID=2773454 RepID=UPI00174D52CF|nr:TRAP transporter large permease [Marinomonas algicola]